MLSTRIKDRIEMLKAVMQIRSMDESEYDQWEEGYRYGRNAAEDDEIDFLVEVLDALERADLKEKGFNV